MSATYYARMTAAGLAAVAAAYEVGDVVGLMEMGVGDGGGVSYNPTGAETELVNQRARVSLSAVERVAGEPTHLRVSAVIPASVGGWWIREAGLFDADGVLFAIAKFPPTYKPTIADGGGYDLIVSMTIVVNAAVSVSILQDDSNVYATQDWTITHLDFHAVTNRVVAPPATPAIGETYLILASATGAFEDQDAKLAYWRGAEQGWLIFAPRAGVTICDAATGLFWRFTGAAWRALMASEAEHLASSASLFANPAGVAAMIASYAKSRRGRTYFMGG